MNLFQLAEQVTSAEQQAREKRWQEYEQRKSNCLASATTWFSDWVARLLPMLEASSFTYQIQAVHGDNITVDRGERTRNTVKVNLIVTPKAEWAAAPFELIEYIVALNNDYQGVYGTVTAKVSGPPGLGLGLLGFDSKSPNSRYEAVGYIISDTQIQKVAVQLLAWRNHYIKGSN